MSWSAGLRWWDGKARVLAMVVTIHQPEHLPWLGFFDKVRQAEVFVLLDHVQFRKRYFQNRNRIRGEDGTLWVAVPVQVKGRYTQPINEVRIDNGGNRRWRQKCWRSLTTCYEPAPWFRDHAPFFEQLYRREWERLVDLNEAIIQYLFSAFDIHPRWVKSSTLGVEGAKGALMLEICRAVGADAYLSGISGRDYLDLESFAEAGIAVQVQEFHHPVYRQRYEPFIPCLSAIDLLFNHGPSSRQMLDGVGVETLTEVFE